MGTNIRPEISEKNKYYIDRHRYYELKHFCLQYPLWRKNYNTIDGYSTNVALGNTRIAKTNTVVDPVYRLAEAKLYFYERMKMVERTAEEADPFLANYILMAVTEGRSYVNLKARFNMPCSKDNYYEVYRRFFWLLSKARN